MAQRPETASVLAQPLVLALGLPESLSGFAGSPRFGIQAGLRAALEADPDNTLALYDRLSRSLDQDQRGVLFHAFTDVLRRSRGEHESPAELARVALDGVFGRLGGDWGDDLVDHAIEALELLARQRPELLADRVDAVFGALLAAVAAPHMPPTSGQILRPPSPLEALERTSRQFVRGNRIARLRKLVGLLASLRPEETLAGVEAVLDRASLPDDEATQELRGHAVRLLGDLGKRPEMAPRVLPRLVSFALGPSVIERTHAIEALGEIGTVAHRRLPDDVLELVPVWLADPYKGPHQAAARALSDGFPVSESVLVDVIARLMILAKVYADEDMEIPLGISLRTPLVAACRNSSARPARSLPAPHPPLLGALGRQVHASAKHLAYLDLARVLDRHDAARAAPIGAGLLNPVYDSTD